MRNLPKLLKKFNLPKLPEGMNIATEVLTQKHKITL